MAVKLNKLVSDLVASAPPGELTGVAEDLNTILDNEQTSLVNNSIETFFDENFGVFSNTFVVSKLNKDQNSSKYIDYVNKKLFNIDVSNQAAIDIESLERHVELPGYFDDLVKKLEQYGDDHFPSTFAFTVIPDVASGRVHIILIGERLNNENFYTGQWRARYTVTETGDVTGDIKLDIHYFEDGNVRLNFDEKVSESISSVNGGSIVNLINKVESSTTIKLMETFNDLNQKSFKNLRRLLPVTRSKINWGKAIGNYRLGSDVVNKQ